MRLGRALVRGIPWVFGAGAKKIGAREIGVLTS
jgi:hypothetical protein